MGITVAFHFTSHKKYVGGCAICNMQYAKNMHIACRIYDTHTRKRTAQHHNITTISECMHQEKFSMAVYTFLISNFSFE